MLDPKPLFWMHEIKERWFVNRNELTSKNHRKFQAKTEIIYYIKYPFLIFSCTVERGKGWESRGRMVLLKDRAL